MRISDWSSDGCSSDLDDGDMARAPQQRLGEGDGAGCLRRPVPGDEDVLADLGRTAWRRQQHRPAALEEGRLQGAHARAVRSEEHTSELQSLMRISYAVFCLKKKTTQKHQDTENN